jgi:hypothetical protein
MFNNLGITHIEQGTQFKNLNKKIYSENEHKFLQETSSPEWGSVVEAFNGTDSAAQQNAITVQTASSDELQFNNLVSDYATAYKTYTSSMLSKPPTDANRIAMEAALTSQKNTIIAAANKINNDISNNSGVNARLVETLASNRMTINNGLMTLSDHKNNAKQGINKFDNNTIAGSLETTGLNMNSMYYHYIVYFIVSITLISFTFNIMINPEANVMNAIYVVGALILVFLIARRYAI